jgi:hypothetical protein
LQSWIRVPSIISLERGSEGPTQRLGERRSKLSEGAALV